MGLDERVLVVPADEFDRLGRFQGFHADAERYLDALLAPGRASFRPRREVEDDSHFKQLIPYVVFRAGELIFTYARGKSGTEARLRSLRSIGVGGHVAEEDADGVASLMAYERALRRELAEEVAVAGRLPAILPRVGLINDDSNAVGRVHLGVVHLVDLNEATVEPREDALADPQFVALTDLLVSRDRYETWSQIVIDSALVGQAFASTR